MERAEERREGEGESARKRARAREIMCMHACVCRAAAARRRVRAYSPHVLDLQHARAQLGVHSPPRAPRAKENQREMRVCVVNK